MKQLIAAIALTAMSWGAHSASVVDLGVISGSHGPDVFSFYDGFDFHSISFEVDADSPYKFTIEDLNTGPGTFGGGTFSTDVMDKLGLEIREVLPDTSLSGPLGGAGFDQPATSMAMFTIALETGKQYVGSFVGLTTQGAELGQASLTISAVPIPAPVLLLGSAIAGLVVVRRRFTREPAAV